MKTFSGRYRTATGWSPSLPDWDSESTLVLVFASPNMAEDKRWLNDLAKKYPRSIITGCSTAGEIIGQKIEDSCVAIAVTKFEKTRLTFSMAEIRDPQNSLEAGQRLAKPHIDTDLRGLFVISEGLHVNGSLLVQGIGEILPASTVVTGGLAADGSDFKKTWIIHEGKLKSDIVTAVGFHGKDIHIQHGSQGGWQIFGPERRITKSERNILYELDGEPALDLYKRYLGELANDLPSSGLFFPLQIRDPKQPEKTLVRTILAVDEKTKSVAFAATLPEGWSAQLMRCNFESLVDGASEAATMTRTTNSTGPTLAIAISCVGRRLVLRERAEEEVEATLEKFPGDTCQIGFYSYGEICPLEQFRTCELHNQTMTITTLWEVA